MPSLLGHAVAGLAITAACHDETLPRRTWPLAVLCAVAPDLDWFVGLFNVHRGHVLNHRGAAHSLFAALLVATAITLLAYRRRQGRVWLCLACAALSHGLLDTFTAGGVGVALFAPFSETRWACVWQPVRVAPLPLSREHLFNFLDSLWTEALWIWLPAVGAAAFVRMTRRAGLGLELSEAVPESLS